MGHTIAYLITRNTLIMKDPVMIEILLDPFRYDFMIRSLITAFASGAMLSLLGPFTINRNMGFMADAMAHATLPIIAVGVFLGFSISELGVPAAILIAIFLGLIIKNTNVGEDTAIGIIFSSFFALGFVLISLLNVTVNLEDLPVSYTHLTLPTKA